MRSQNAAVAVTALVLGLLLFASWNQEHLRVAQGLVVYCAHDLEYAEPILMEFEKQTGIAIVLVGDTEANKSLGLVERLLREKAQPRGDLFWNNQALGTERLQQAGVLQPYRGSGYARIPSKYKAEDGSWTGFAGRLRVWIINTKKLEATDQAVTTALAAPDLSRFALAKPLFGTTLSHYSLLWQRRGGDWLKKWHQELVSRGAKIVPGNAAVKDLVGNGVCDLGMTDSDDFYVSHDAGQAVSMRPIRVDGKTICLPNTVAIIRGTSHLPEAQRLVDYLLSAEVELRLANCGSRQIPLGPVEENSLSSEVRQLRDWAEDAAEMSDQLDAQHACLLWLTTLFAP